MTIEEFIEARIAERQTAAEFALELEKRYGSQDVEVNYEWVRFSQQTGGRGVPSSMFVPGAPPPDEVLRQCTALRRIVSDAGDIGFQAGDPTAADAYALPFLAAVAVIWSDHPDYQPEWAVDAGGLKP